MLVFRSDSPMKLTAIQAAEDNGGLEAWHSTKAGATVDASEIRQSPGMVLKTLLNHGITYQNSTGERRSSCFRLSFQTSGI